LLPFDACKQGRTRSSPPGGAETAQRGGSSEAEEMREPLRAAVFVVEKEEQKSLVNAS
jgi:hypothetical protein